jgi:hypothetical protein
VSTSAVLLALGEGSGSRVPVLACRDALRAGAEVTVVQAETEADVDAAVAGPLGDPSARLVIAGGDVAAATVLRRMVRRVRPRGGDRTGLRDDRTIPDLPPVGLLPLDTRAEHDGSHDDLVAHLGLPRSPELIAEAVLGAQVRRLDLLRTDSGAVTLHGAVVGAADQHGNTVPYAARVDVDSTVLSDGSEPLLATVVVNAAGYGTVGGVPLVTAADPGDGAIDVAVATTVTSGGRLRRRKSRVEVRRATGRAVAITVRPPDGSGDLDGTAADSDPGVPYVQDGTAGTLRAKRTWWMERGAWAVFTLA